MFTSVTDRSRRSAYKTTVSYGVVTVLCAVFGIVYEILGHNMWSPNIRYMFLIPLCAGCIPFLILGLTGGARFITRIGFNLWNSGVAVLAVMSAMRGVYSVAGVQASRYLPAFLYTGIILLSASVVVNTVLIIVNKKKRQ